MPSCASTRNSCGRTCRTSRSSGSEMLRAASMARRTSSRSMSRGRCPSVTPPRLFTPRTWPPATPISADSTGTLATPSDSSAARRIELTVESRLTIRPLRSPLDSAAPSARNFTCSSSISAISTDVLVLPMSSPTKNLSFFAKLAPAPELSRSRDRSCGAAIGVQNHLPRILQIDGAHPAIAGLPLREVVHHHAVFAGKIVLAELDADRLRIVGRGDARHHHTQIARITEIDFAHAVGRAAANHVDIAQEFLVGLHASSAFIARHVFTQARNNGKLEIFAARAVENNAVDVDKSKLGAVAQEGDRCTLRDFHANTIRQNALHAGGLHPRQFFEGAAASIQRNADHAAIAVARKLLEYRLAADDAVAGQFDLVGLEQRNFRRIQQKFASHTRSGEETNSDR